MTTESRIAPLSLHLECPTRWRSELQQFGGSPTDIPAAPSSSSSQGLINVNTSKPWPENCAYVQAHHRQAGQPALPAETPSSIRALDRGAGCVTVNDLVKTVHENESIYIPIGAVHRLENPGKIQLELIEVQTGSYFGEDDIIRIEDDYQRT